MRDRLNSFVDSVKELWGKTTKKMRILFLSALAGVLLLSLVLVIILNHSNYVVLYDNLTVSENAAVLAQLQEMGVEGRLENSRLLVPEEDELAVRMQLATKGYPDAGFDYDIFEAGTGLTATQFVQKQSQIYQLQERLQATIRTFPEVQEAYVTISIPENSMFVLQDEIVKPSAAVKIQKVTGRTLTDDQVRGILSIVKNAIPGIEQENISIVDETGDLMLSLEMGNDANNTKLQLTEQVNESVRRRIMSMLVPLYGDGVNVAVNSVLDTDENITDIITYMPLDPENPQNNALDYVQTEYERSGGTAIAEGVPGATDNTDVPAYNAFNEDDGTGDYYHSQTMLDYLVSSERNQIVKEGLTIADMTVAVLIDAEGLPVGERDQIIDLVANASGVPTDKVSVQSIQFYRETLYGSFDGETPSELNLPLLIMIGIGSLALIMIIVMIISYVLRRRREARLAAAEGLYYEEDEASLIDLMGAQEEDFEPITLAETNEQKLKAQIKDLANSDPEIVAHLLKTWLLNA